MYPLCVPPFTLCEPVRGAGIQLAWCSVPSKRWRHRPAVV